MPGLLKEAGKLGLLAIDVTDPANPFEAGRYSVLFASGSGLGLFICRELCGSNGAALLYDPREGGGSIFRIIFADPRRWET